MGVGITFVVEVQMNLLGVNEMMINHCTLDYHVINFNTFCRWL